MSRSNDLVGPACGAHSRHHPPGAGPNTPVSISRACGDVAGAHAQVNSAVWALWRFQSGLRSRRHLAEAASSIARNGVIESQKSIAGPTQSGRRKEITGHLWLAPPNWTISSGNCDVPLTDFERSLSTDDRAGAGTAGPSRKLVVNGKQLRGPCPLHAPHKARSRHFSVSTDKNVFRCFAPECQAHGNALDLYAAATKLPIHEAGWKLVDLLHLEPTRTEKRNP